MIRKVTATSLAICSSLIAISLACTHTRPNTEKNISAVVGSSIEATQRAREFIKNNSLDVSQYEMSQPQSTQEVNVGAGNAWRIAWGLKGFSGKGGQLIILVHQDGKSEVRWGE